MRETIGFTNGCFDLLHKGHEQFLVICKGYCTRLVVGINTDASVHALKGAGRPVEPLIDRVRNIRKVGVVDEIIPFITEQDLQYTIGRVCPDWYFKGDEYYDKPMPSVGHARIVFIPMLYGFSTTSEIAKRG